MQREETHFIFNRAPHLQVRLRQVRQLAQGHLALPSGIAGAGAHQQWCVAPHTPRGPQGTTCQQGFHFLSLGSRSTLRQGQAPWLPGGALLLPLPPPSPASSGPPPSVPTLHPQVSRRTGRTPVWHSSRGLPGGLIAGCGQQGLPRRSICSNFMPPRPPPRSPPPLPPAPASPTPPT